MHIREAAPRDKDAILAIVEPILRAGDTPNASGQGLARKMCEDSLVRAKNLGYRAMQFNFVIASNAAAIHLWPKLGFEVVGRLPGAFMHPILGETDALVMYRKL